MCAKKITTTTTTNEPGEEISVYIGPTMHRRAMVTASCYRGGLPDHVVKLMEKIPELAWMIVPLKDVAAVKMLIKEQGTQENGIFKYIETVRFDGNGEVRKQ